MDDLVWKSLGEQARLIASKQVSPVEVVTAHLDRIEALDPKLRAFITVMRDGALETARAAEAQVLSGQPLPPLHGVPIALKDLYQTKDAPTTGGSKILARSVATEDATVVSRLRAAGAIVLGKLNLHEFAYGPEGLNAHYGTAWNPWDARSHRIAGGSSSGSGVAVAAGLCAGALGSDTGGSIRIPAALCGITGLKPTYGRVSRAGVLPLAWSLDHVGPMARSAADCALMLGPMAGRDEKDPTTSTRPVGDYVAALSGDVKGVRVGVLRPFFLEAAGLVLRQAIEQATRELATLGAQVDDASLSYAPHAVGASFAVIASEALAYHEVWLKQRPGDYQADVRERLKTGAFVTGAQYLRGQRARQLIRDEVNRALERFDVLIAPSTPIVATAVGQAEVTIEHETVDVRSALTRFTRHFNLSGHPACSVPCGFTTAGLPIGMQIVGRAFDEATVLRVADAYQRATDWHTRRPPAGAPPAPAATPANAT
jgi:aspartyl-tRNA(Asn)/glutamyl-tRNA(Gln) amidotransferase subunit A